MKKNGGLHIKIVLFALITSVLTAVANLLIENFFRINVFSFGLWFVLPVGAFIVGMGGASGGFLACKYFNLIPTKLDALVLSLVAAFTMFLIYYLGYITLVSDDGLKVSTVIDFYTYINFVVTKAHMSIGGALQHDAGEVGSLGYLLLALKFFGVLLGGFSIFTNLKELPVCDDCNVYYKKIAVKDNLLPSTEYAQTVYKKMKNGTVEDYASVLEETDKGDCDVKITFTLMRCPKCKDEFVREEFFVKNEDRSFVEVKDLNGKTRLPKDSNLALHFKKS